MKAKLLFTAAILVITLTLTALTGCTVQTDTTKPVSASRKTLPTAEITSPGPAADAIGNFEATLESIYERTNPSVVNIQVVLPPSGISPGGSALGSGFVWDTEGNIITNNHVIDGATRITVVFYDGTTVDAKLTGADADSDLAVIKVNPEGLDLRPVTMADSALVKVGQLAIAIGNPFGLQGTMTTGFISGVGRLLPATQNTVGPNYSIPDIIQTDAAINPGNSGGVLLDDTGAVIGITQSIATTSGTSAGVGFAIPSAIIKQVVPALIKTGHYDHPYLGVSVGTMNPDIAAAMKLTANQHGALINSITAGGPAEKAGLKGSGTKGTINGLQVNIGGDVITAINGQTVKSSDDLITFLARSGVVGQVVTFTILRDGKEMQVQVTLGTRPNNAPKLN